MTRLRVATWNVNSVRLRAPQIERLIGEMEPDIICFQELKAAADVVPLDALKAFGLPHIRFEAMKGYNGVMIMSRFPLDAVESEAWGGGGDARHVGARVHAPGFASPIRIDVAYVPAGGDVPNPDENPKFRHKLDFMSDLTSWAKTLDRDDARIFTGDLNIAPLDCDVWSHKQLLNVVSHTPVETDAMDAFRQAGDWVDAVRQRIPAPEKLYSWWSYRARDWAASDRGRRLDHIWTSQALKPAIAGAGVWKEARSWEKPSDHAPVWVDFEADR